MNTTRDKLDALLDAYADAVERVEYARRGAEKDAQECRAAIHAHVATSAAGDKVTKPRKRKNAPTQASKETPNAP